jgi:hypothetical protein
LGIIGLECAEGDVFQVEKDGHRRIGILSIHLFENASLLQTRQLRTQKSDHGADA